MPLNDALPPDNLDPRRRSRTQRRDWQSITPAIAIPRVHELLATVLVRLGLVR